MDKPEEKTLYLATLVYPVRDSEVLLATKTRKIGAGCLNGWGGGVDQGESIRASAAREFFEETGGAKVNENELEKIGIVHFKNHKSDGVVFVCIVHVYSTKKWTADIISTDEMKNPRWYLISQITQEKLMPADPFWLPRMLTGEKGIAWAEYDPFQTTLIGEVCFEPRDFLEEE